MLREKKGRLLDAGCGPGFVVKNISAFEGWEVYGCEISPAAVNYAKEKLGLENVVSGNISDAGFEEESFDIITMWDVIEHIPDPGPFLSGLNRLLKKNGILFVHTPNIKIQLPKAKLKKALLGMKKKAIIWRQRTI